MIKKGEKRTGNQFLKMNKKLIQGGQKATGRETSIDFLA